MRTNGFDLRQRRYLLFAGVAILVFLAVLAGLVLRPTLGARLSSQAANSPTASGITTSPLTAIPSASVPAAQSPTATASSTRGPTRAPTSTPSSGSSIPAYDHVVVILEENHAYQEIVGDTTDAPYINNTLVPKGALASNYFAVAHPSLPNYLALTSGDTWDISDDSPPSSHPLSVANLARELDAAGKSWRGYMEDMPSNCDKSDAGAYAVRHNPFAYYTNLSDCGTNDVPFSHLASDFASASTTPSFAFITPNLNDDMHDGSINQGDTWLANNMPTILNSPAFTQQHSLLVVTWDEDDSSGSNQVATIFDGYAVAAGHSSTVRYSHYSLLKTIEAGLGLGTMTGNDASAAVMKDMLTTR